MRRAVLGVDLASSLWRRNGTATLEWNAGGWCSVEAGVVTWPQTGRPTAKELARRIELVCDERGVAAVSIDGPQGWRDPAEAREMRACEQALATPGKTGTVGSCKPPSALPWVELSIELFDRLLATGRAELANSPDPDSLAEPARGRYHVLECFPTSTWRRAGLTPLPPPSRRPDVAQFTRSLCTAFGLPRPPLVGHDDLQAIVAALPAAALAGGPVDAVAAGIPAWENDGTRVEGLIWDAVPARATSPDAAAAPFLVIVTGPPGAGKTTLASPLARALGLPLVARDELKETLYAELGTGDVEWTRRLGRASFALLHVVAARLLEQGSSVVVEANFFRGDSEAAFRELPPHRLVQVHCSAPADVVLARYGGRPRHPGHLDAERADEVAARLRDGTHDPLDLPSIVISVDTSDAVDVEALAEQIREATAARGRG